MARGVNKVILIGNLGNDPDVRYTPAGAAVANLSIATSEVWNDKQTGQKQEKTEWHRVVFFGKSAELAQQYLHKGSKVFIEGKLQTRKWQDNSGQDRYTTEVVVNGINTQFQMLDGQNPQPAQYQQAPQQPQQRPANHPAQQAPQNNQYQQACNSQQPAPQQGYDEYDPNIPF